MAKSTSSDGEHPEVKLRDPEGNEVTVSNPGTVNSLVYGQGYSVVGDDTPEAAAAKVAPNVAQPPAGTPAAGVTSGATTSNTTKPS